MSFRLNIKQRFGLSLVFIIAINTSIILYALQQDASRQVREQIGRYLAETAFQFSDRLDKDMWTRSKELEQLKRSITQVAGADIAPTQQAIDQLSREIPSFSWIGLTDATGMVRASTDNILLGQSIAQRPVFAKARDKAFIGDVHDAVLLAKLLPNPTGEAMKFVDLSTPVFTDNGVFRGVLVAHLSWNWVSEIEETYFKPAYAKDNIELLIIAADGTVLLGPKAMLGAKLDLALLETAKRRNPTFATGTWPDGGTYVAGVAYGDGYKDYPGLGWTVVARQPVGLAYREVYELRRDIITIGAAFSLLAALGGVLLAGHLARPLNTIVTSSRRLLAGEIDNIPPYRGIPDIETLTEALRNLIDNLRRTRREKDRMEEMAFVDLLTGLPNRAAFQKRVQELGAHPLRKNQAVAVLYLDLDGFKTVNDTLGHQAGDMVLAAVALRLKGCLRGEDAVARLGGDEFVILLQTTVVEAQGDVRAAAKRIIKAVNHPIPIGDAVAQVGCSLGGAIWPAHAPGLDDVVRFADAALYVSKNGGKNRLSLHRAGPEAEQESGERPPEKG